MSALSELKEYTFVSKYARWLPEKNRRETWREAVDRVKHMMLDYYQDKGINDDIEWAYNFMLKKKVLGSQRALQFGGAPALKKHARIYNCVSSPVDRPRFFQECIWLLLCGCGTGFSVQKHHVAKLPPLSKDRLAGKKRKQKTFIIPDTIEGWADAFGILLTTYWDVAASPEFEEWVGYDVIFDYSAIRPKGAPLSSSSGKAPGPDGLHASLDSVRELLDEVIIDKQERLAPIDCYDIIMHEADAVLSGGVRRSACICVFSPDDLDMAMAKVGNWKDYNPQRGRSNNSAILLRNSTGLKQFQELIKCTREHGEPGFLWVDDLEFLMNPCAEVGMWCYRIINQAKFDKYMETYDGTGYKCDLSKMGLESGWQGCNLSTINASSVRTLEEFEEAGKAAAIIGTLQAGFTELHYLTDTSISIFQREALLGVSMTGMMENYEIVLNPENQRHVAKVIIKTNLQMAKKIGINPAARTTCLKPEGTSSCLLGTSSSLHPHHSKRYLRFLQTNKQEEPYQHFRKTNPTACEESVWSPHKTDDVLMFPIEVPDGAKTKNQLPALELLKIVKSTQQNWVKPGKVKSRCTQPWLSHNVSNTITVMPDEWDAVTKYIYNNRKHFCGITLVPHSGDKDYAQVPFTAVYTPREIVREYGDAALWTSGLIEIGLDAFNNLWTACDNALDPMADLQQPAATPTGLYGAEVERFYSALAKQAAFRRKIKRFADSYFDGDIKRLTYCMKDVFNWKRYYDLNQSFKSVDYTVMFEDEDNTNLEGEIACAGGACLI